MIANAIEIDGTLEPDGKLILDERPALPPGRVRVALQKLEEFAPRGERVPERVWLDATIPAPFDLPRGGVLVRVQPRQVAERLPELPVLAEDAG